MKILYPLPWNKRGIFNFRKTHTHAVVIHIALWAIWSQFWFTFQRIQSILIKVVSTSIIVGLWANWPNFEIYFPANEKYCSLFQPGVSSALSMLYTSPAFLPLLPSLVKRISSFFEAVLKLPVQTPWLRLLCCYLFEVYLAISIPLSLCCFPCVTLVKLSGPRSKNHFSKFEKKKCFLTVILQDIYG